MTEPGPESSADPTNLAGGDAAAERAYPRISQAIGLIVVGIVLTVVFDIPVWIGTRPHTEIRSIAGEIVQSLSLGLVIWYGFGRTGQCFRDVFPLQPFRVALLVPIVLMLLGVIILAAEINYVLQMAWPKPESMKEATQGLLGGSVWITFLAMVVLAPVTEEFLFRGVILQGFLRNYGRRKAILVSALLFALFHLNPWQFPVAFLLGVVLGWWVTVTGSLLPCLFGHALGNSLRLLMSVVERTRITPGNIANPSWPDWLVLGLLGMGLLATGAWLERRWRVGATT
jgi:membrane protease YdiL (CAAX protease family)